MLIIALPYVIQYAITKGLTDAGVEEVTVDDVDFNPFTGKLSISNLRAKRQHSPTLSVNSLILQVDWLPLFKKRLLITSLAIKDSSLKIEKIDEQTLYVGGINIPLDTSEKGKKESPSSTWGIGLNKLYLVNNFFTYQSQIFSDSFTINDLNIDQALSWEPNQVSGFSFNTQLNESFISGNITVSMFSDTPLIKGQLNIQKLNLNDFQPLVKEYLQELKGLVSSNVEFSVRLGKNTIDYKQTGSLSINQVTITTPSLNSAFESATWSGSAQYTTASETPSLYLQGQLEFNELSSKNPQTKMSIASAHKLAIKDLTINQTHDIKVSSIEVDGLSVAKTDLKHHLIDSKKVLIEDFYLQNLKDIGINKINLAGLTAQIDINKQGDIVLLKKLTDSLPASEEKKVDKTNDSSKPAQFHLAGLAISKDSYIKFSKETEQGSIKKDIFLNRVSIGDINSQTPKKPTPLDIKATIDKFSTLTIGGNIFPFSEKTNIALQTKLSAFELHGFSPIIREQLGYNIQNGQLNADLDINIKDNILDGETSVEINQLVLDAADENKMAKMTQQLSMPLDSALSLLRDDNDDIKLEIPIKGDLTSPDFNIGDIINTALGNALQGTVKNILKYALQPYGLIFMAAEKAYGVATAIKLDALTFPPGQDILPPDSANYLKRVGELMQKRPQLRIRVCGFATTQDRLFLQSQPHKIDNSLSKEQLENLNNDTLLELAKNRQIAVKSHLVTTYQLETTRLFACKPQIETAPNKKVAENPRVELLI